MIYRLALVEYLNTFPFSEGFRLLNAHDLSVFPVTPAECARMFRDGEAEISLCPVGALGELPDHRIFGKYCIGADGKVGTVMLFSNKPIDEIHRVKLDHHSRTSNLLLQVLAKHFWKNDWSFYFDEDDVPAESCVMIGDKVFESRSKYSFHYDLGEQWKLMTGLPMVFAVWIARKSVPEEILQRIDRAFELGMDAVFNSNGRLQDWEKDYLLNNIDYPFDEDKKKTLKLFQALLS